VTDNDIWRSTESQGDHQTNPTLYGPIRPAPSAYNGYVPHSFPHLFFKFLLWLQ